jgi:uncharacterized protein YjaZ
MKIVFAESEFWDKNKKFIDKYTKTIEQAYKKSKKLLPDIPDQLTFVLQTNDWECIPEFGHGGNIHSSRLILLSLDPEMPYSEEQLLLNTEATVVHELNHSARYELGIQHKKFIEACILEGIACVFEREYSKLGSPLWAKYDTEVIKDWFNEVNKDILSNWDDYMFLHPDGRRWIGYKVGTWIVDNAMKNSKKTIESITKLECSEIIELANI